MKKQNITKVLLACLIVAMSGFVLNLQAQDIVLEFTNPDGGDYGSGNAPFDGTGLGGYGDDAVEDAGDPYVEFAFTIGATGQIGLDVSTPTTYQPVVDVLNTWDNAAIGATSNAALFGKSFSLILTAESRMQLGSDSDGNRGGLGVRGENQRRLDDEGEDNEWMQFELTGDVGIDFVRFGYNDVDGGDLAHALIKDHDTDKIWPILDDIDGDPHPPELYLDMAEYNMRYFSDILYFSKADTSDVGYRIYSLEFNVVQAEPKPPAVSETMPAHADTTVETTADYMIQFDVPVNQSSAEGAITFDPVLPNQAFAWNEAGDMVTISHDQLPYATVYLVTISTGVKGAGDAGLNMLADTTFTFKTLPQPPTIDYTFPANIAQNVPLTTPFELRFSKGMIPDSVEKAIEFTPTVGGLEFIWNSDNSIAYFSADELAGNTQYFVTVGTVATDRFGVQLAEPFQFVFTTTNPVGVDNQKLSKMILYPNPADDVLTIRGIDVKSVKIYSMTGQIIRQVSDKSLINVSEINPGAYIINVQDRNSNQYKEVIIIK